MAALQTPKSRIGEYLLLTLCLPIIVVMELNELSEDISLAITGGKYRSRSSLARGRYLERFNQDELDGWDWMRPPDYPQKNFALTLRRLRRRKFIDKRPGKHGWPEIIVTSAGKNELTKKFPLTRLANRPWKGWWLVVAFDIEETDRKTRNLIRKQLLRLGFVQWQKSVYVCPHDIADDLNQVLKDYRLEDKVVPMISKRILAGSDWDFARRLFGIDRLKKEYDTVVKALTGDKSGGVSRRDWQRQFQKFLNIVSRDPFLPVGLPPAAGYGREAAWQALTKTAKM